MSDKTEEATPQRLRKAKQEGDSPVSSALTQAVGFVAALAIAPIAVVMMIDRVGAFTRFAMSEPFPEGSASVLLCREVLFLAAPVVLVSACATGLTSMVQSGGVISVKKITPDFTKLNPITGLKQLVSLQRIIGLARALVTALFVAYLAKNLLISDAPALATTVGNLDGGMILAGLMLKGLAWNAAGVGLALAGADVGITIYSWKKRLRMSKDEIKREHKESEGDPEIKHARKRAHEEAMRGNTIRAVKNASVLVVNPTHLATALSYDQELDEAPRVIAQGRGDLAKAMIDAARDYGVPVVRDIPVAHALQDLEIGDEIPEALYEAVAEILRDAWEQAEPQPPEPEY